MLRHATSYVGETEAYSSIVLSSRRGSSSSSLARPATWGMDGVTLKQISILRGC